MRRIKALTLIGLLVAFAIIVLLLAIPMPALRTVRQQACRANLKGVGLAVRMYLDNNDFVMHDFTTHTNNCNVRLRYGQKRGYLLKAGDNRPYWCVIYCKHAKDENLWGRPGFLQFTSQKVSS